MQKKELIEYLNIVVDMEKDIFMKKEMIGKINRKIYALGKKRYIQPPKQENRNRAKMGYGFAIFGAVMGLFCGAYIMDTFEIGPIAAWAMFIAGGFLVDLVCYAVKWIKVDDAERERYQAYEQQLYEDAQRVEREQREIIYWQSEIESIQTYLTQSERRLAQAYGRNVIFPKYRNFIMVSSILEYFLSGICSSLEGRDGAYAILEQNIRLDKIIVNQEKIIQELQQIKQTQYMVYTAITDVGTKMDRILYSNEQMLREVHKVGDNMDQKMEEMIRQSASASYCAERTQKELEYMNRMDYLCGRNDNAFDNTPPN